MPLVHEHLIVRAEINKPPTDTEFMDKWLRDLTKDLGMKIMMGPFSSYCPMIGNRGLTGAAIIETSHIAIHVWDERKPSMLQLDVYSCAPVDRVMVLKKIRQFDPVSVDYKFLDRTGKFIKML